MVDAQCAFGPKTSERFLPLLSPDAALRDGPGDAREGKKGSAFKITQSGAEAKPGRRMMAESP